MRNVWLVITLCLGAAFAQEKKYPFVNYEHNVIYHGKDSSDMLGFYRKLNNYIQGEEREIVIAHIGGSHVQAGFWGDQLTYRFKSLRKAEGGGFFAFPHKIVKTNSPPYYKSFTDGNWYRCRSAIAREACSELGCAQVSASTNDSLLTFGIRIDSSRHHRSFNSIKVFHNFNPSFRFVVAGNMLAQRREYPGAGYTEFLFDKLIDSVNFVLARLDTAQPDFILYGFDIRNTSEPGVYYAALGANGASTQSILRCTRFAQQLAVIKPDLVILSLGVNDVQGDGFNSDEFIAHYDTLLAWIKSASPSTAVLFTTITDNYVKRRKANKKSNTVEYCIQKLMHKHNAAMWDMYGVMGGYKSILKWQKAGYARKDRVHFTAKGYYIFADLMFDALMRSYRYNYPK
jgi:lysophospholipase L1-like esterase